MKRLSLLMNCWKVQQIFIAHFEAHNQSKCKKQVWKQYVYPLFGMNYNTFLRYLDADTFPLVEKGFIDIHHWQQIHEKMEHLLEMEENVPA